MCFFSHLLWVIVMLENTFVTHLQCSVWRKESWAPSEVLQFIAQPISPSMWSICPVPLAEKQFWSIMFPPTCWTEVGVIWVKLSSSLLPNTEDQVDTKSSILVGLSPKPSLNHRCSLTNLRLYVCLLEEGVLAGAARSIHYTVVWYQLCSYDCGLNFFQVINKLVLCSFRLTYHLWSPSPHEGPSCMDLDGHFMYLQFLNNHTNSC